MPSWGESVQFLPWVSKAQNSRTLSHGPEEYLKVIELVPNNRRHTTSRGTSLQIALDCLQIH